MKKIEDNNHPTRTNLDGITGDVYFKFDRATGLRAIIAIHNLNRGPAIGGCRLATYQTVGDALEDVLRLAYMMSYKSAISNLPHGGAKAVLIKPKVIKNRVAYFEKFGEFIQELDGRYIVAVDSGTNPSDMDIIARKTDFITCSTFPGSSGDPSPLTAFGVRRGIEAAVKFQLGKSSLENLHISIQGAGHVGYCLAKELHGLGARLTMCDINKNALERCVDEFGVNTCSPEAIYDIKADIFSPCALGAILNSDTIHRLPVAIIAGAANNQLAHRRYAETIRDRDILYVPDFVLNAGGLIHIAVIYAGGDTVKSKKQVSLIYNTLTSIFETSKQDNRTPNDIAETIAKERL